MTELDIHRSADTAPVQVGVDPTGGRLVAWAQSLFAAKQLADALCRTTFAPQHFRGKPEDAAAAILFGDEIGLTPGQALQNVHVISGKPGLYARTMVALVLSKGHSVWTEVDTPDKVVVCGTRKGSAHVERSEWTKTRARTAGYTNNKKYDTDPQAMLYARAASDVCRKVAPDALAGLAYSVEEYELEEASTSTVTRVGRAEPVKVARKAVTPMPEPDAEPVVSEPDGPVLITDPQMRNMRRLLSKVGIGDRDDVLAYVAATIGRDVGSSTELTKVEAGRVIESLMRDAGESDSVPEPTADVDRPEVTK